MPTERCAIVRRVRVVLAGGSGSLGRRVADDLASRGHNVVILTRQPDLHLRHRTVTWDGRTDGPWMAELAGAALINLAGQLVDLRPTRRNIELLTSSRVDPTLALVRAAARLESPVPVWIQMSTVAIYGDAGERVLTEDAPPASGPPQMAGVARAWEASSANAHTDRKVILRTSIVLDRESPALSRLTSLTRFGMGASAGTGQQWFSWIHVDDWLRIVRLIIEEPDDDLAPSGVLHATSPNPVRNRDLMSAMRKILRRPPVPRIPTPLVRAGALAMRTDPALVLTGRWAVPARLLRDGFHFEQPALEPALMDLLR